MKRPKRAAALPPFAIAHVVSRVASVAASAAFYARIGLRRVWIARDMAIFELRGGTHLLLFARRGKLRGRAVKAAPFDLMTDDLDAAHARLRRRGCRPSPLRDDAPGGHRCFTLLGPDRLRLTVYSSHTEDRRV